MTANATDAGTWTTPVGILTDDSVKPDSIALAVFSDTNPDALDGIRVYYG